MSWLLIESDPDLFTELVGAIGVEGVQFEELYSLDPSSFENKGPVHGLIFLFRWQNTPAQKEKEVEQEKFQQVYFAKQVVENACATQAILSIVLNQPNLRIGPILTQFKDFTKNFSPQMKGLTLSNSNELRKIHNSFAKITTDELCAIPDASSKESSSVSQKFVTQDADTFHFIGYVPVDGQVYELDGLSSGPVLIGPYENDNWLLTAQPAIQQRIENYSSSEIRFNLMAMVANRLQTYTNDLRSAEALLQHIEKCLSAFQENPVLPEDLLQILSAHQIADPSLQGLLQRKEKLTEQIADLSKKVKEEDERTRKRIADNFRRKFNYFPFMVEMLKILGRKGELTDLLKLANGR